MLLHDFLTKYEKQVLARTEESLIGEGMASQQDVTRGVPIFFGQLVEVLRQKEGFPETIERLPLGVKAAIGNTAAAHGDDLLRLGFTISQVVHGYGAVCQAITSLATEMNAPIGTRDFQILNMSLDHAISEAVSQFQVSRNRLTDISEAEHLGILAHELRNTLTSALVSFQIIQGGRVGVGGSTGRLLENSLNRMKDLIDRSLTEVRLKVGNEVTPTHVRIASLLDQVIAVASQDAEARHISIRMELAPDLWVVADPHLVLSALANLVQNAVKFTKDGGTVSLRGFLSDNQVTLEVADECGGLPAGTAEKLLKPFVQGRFDSRGVGLGLTITHKAILASNGELHVRDIPGKGCVFRICLPRSESSTGQGTTSAA